MHFMSPNFHESHKCLKNQLGKEEQLVFSEIPQKPIDLVQHKKIYEETCWYSFVSICLSSLPQ